MSTHTKIKNTRKRQVSSYTKRHKAHILRTSLRRLGMICLLSLAIALIVGMLWAWQTKALQRAQQKGITYAHTVLAHNGFALKKIVIEGTHNSSRPTITKALDLRYGISLLSISLPTLQDKISTLPWIKSALIQRQWPDTLYIRIVEHDPIALWYHRKKYYLVDSAGGIIDKYGRNASYATLPIITGQHAPENFAPLARALQKHGLKITRGQYICNRRWNIAFKNGILLKMPIDSYDRALTRFQKILEKYELNLAKIKEIDLRLKDRAFINPGKAIELKMQKSK